MPASAGFGGEATAAVDPSTKLYREIFVGNTSPEMTDEALKAFVGGALMQMGLSCSGNENPILAVRVNAKFSFLEFRTMEDAANALNFNSIPFMNQQLKFSRPSKYEGLAIPYLQWDDMYTRSLTGELKLMTAGTPSTVLCISNMVTGESCHTHTHEIHNNFTNKFDLAYSYVICINYLMIMIIMTTIPPIHCHSPSNHHHLHSVRLLPRLLDTADDLRDDEEHAAVLEDTTAGE